MKNFGKIAGINIALLLAYSVVIRIIANSESKSSNDRSLSIVVFSAFVVGFHVAACLLIMIIAFATGRRESGQAWLATTGVVLLVGFSVCLGNAALH